MIESAVPSCLALTLTAKARTAAPEFVIPPMPVFKGAIISDGRRQARRRRDKACQCPFHLRERVSYPYDESRRRPQVSNWRESYVISPGSHHAVTEHSTRHDGFVALPNRALARRPHAAATTSRHACMAEARKARCVLAEVRWRDVEGVIGGSGAKYINQENWGSQAIDFSLPV